MLHDEVLLQALRSALRHLYETPALQANALVEYLGLAGSPNAASELRRILIEAIRSLQPEDSVPPEAEIWRVYEILQYRYVQQCTQAEVARQLGLSIRHLRREEVRAAEVLALALQSRWGKDAAAREEPAETENDLVGKELAWLEQAHTQEQFDLCALVGALCELVRPMAQTHRTRIEMALPEGPFEILSQPVGLRQIILSLLTLAIDRAVGGNVRISAQRREGRAYLTLAAQGAGERCADGPLDVEEHIAMAKRLARLCEAEVEVALGNGTFAATIGLTVPCQIPVLVIDDNQDTLRLLERYVADTPFRLIGVRDVEQAFQVAASTPPSVIVLDVMMPRVDGWEALGRLRQHPLTCRTPIIVCTILAQEELARSLGANDYLRKPLAREAFLKALERQCAPVGPGGPSRPPYSAGTLVN